MAPTETERFQLREGLRDVLEEGPVTTLMDSLPPMDWYELATKTDLAALEERMDARFEVVDIRLEALRTELGAKIDMGLTDLSAKFEGVSAKFEGVDAKFEGVDAKFEGVDAKFEGLDARFTEMRGEMKLGFAKQTYVMLVGMAALVTPIYLALFAGLGT